MSSYTLLLSKINHKEKMVSIAYYLFLPFSLIFKSTGWAIKIENIPKCSVKLHEIAFCD